MEKGQNIIHGQEQVHSSHAGTRNRLPRDAVSNLSVEDYFADSPQEQSGIDQLHRPHAELPIHVLVDAATTEEGVLVDPVEEDQSQEDYQTACRDD